MTISPDQPPCFDDFIRRAYFAATTAGHVWPAYAACEAALESGWGRSFLAAHANNLFGQKLSHPPALGTSGSINLPTEEFLHGAMVHVVATWATFPDWTTCLRSRMDLLHRLSFEYQGYAAALAAKDGVSYINDVSAVWSTDPTRAAKVLSIYAQHSTVFTQ